MTGLPVVESFGGQSVRLVGLLDEPHHAAMNHANTFGRPVDPWYLPPAKPGASLKGICCTRAGRWLTNRILSLAEWLGVVSPGTNRVSSLLNASADALVAGGQKGIFTPMCFFLARKPADSQPVC